MAQHCLVPGWEHWVEVHRFCHYCGESLTFETAEPDHKIPKSRGGLDILANLVPACHQCNCMKKDKTEEEFRKDRPVIIQHCEVCEISAISTTIYFSREREHFEESHSQPVENRAGGIACPEVALIVARLSAARRMRSRPRQSVLVRERNRQLALLQERLRTGGSSINGELR